MPNDPLSNYRTDVLFLPMGFNALPNYVAGMLLTKPSSTVYLLYSYGKNGKESSRKVADWVSKALRDKKKDLKVIPIDVEESDKTDIEKKILQVLNHPKFPPGRVGVNYTGGTKPMATHAYRTIEQYGDNDKKPWREKPIFSYLDPRELTLRIETGSSTDAIRVIHHPDVDLNLKDLLKIHDCQWNEKEWINHAIKHAGLARAIAEVHSTKLGFESWKKWLESAKDQGGRLINLPDSNNTHLEPVWTVLQNVCDDQPTPDALAQKLDLSLTSVVNWLQGDWLEDYAFQALSKAMQEILGAAVSVNAYCGKNLKAKQSQIRKIELDLAAVLGYQFFAISCKAKDLGKTEDKLALFEAYVRAAQLGGDEARTGLVCCSTDPGAVEKDVADGWDAEGKIKVFGMGQLLNLKNEFQAWLETANKRRIVK